MWSVLNDCDCLAQVQVSSVLTVYLALVWSVCSASPACSVWSAKAARRSFHLRRFRRLRHPPACQVSDMALRTTNAIFH